MPPNGQGYAGSGAGDVSFTGKQSDIASGSYDFAAREDSPIMARWWTPDPVGLAAVDPANPQSWNRYAYALGNPLTNTDPTGLIAAVPQGCVGMPTADPSTGDYYMCPDDGGFPGRQQLWVDPGDGGGGGGGVESYDPGPPVIGQAPPAQSPRQRQAGDYERAILLRANIPCRLSLLAASKSPLGSTNERRRAAACLLGEIIRLHSTTAKP